MARKLYEEQYEDDLEDDLEEEDEDFQQPKRSLGKWLVWLLFFAPGAAIMWWEYMFPRRGQVYASSRRYQNRFIQVLYTIGFYVLALLFASIIFAAPHKK